MSHQGLTLIPVLFICFFSESFCICDGTIWAKVGWEIFPEEVYYLQVKPPPSYCLPYPLDRLFCSFASMDLFQSSLYLIYILAQALFLILFVLSVHYLWMKWKKHQKKLKQQASLDKYDDDLESPSIYDFDQVLCRLLNTTSMMTKFLRQVSQHSPKKVRHRTLKRKKSKGGEKSKDAKSQQIQIQLGQI
uniref:testis-expressed protein 50 n=1 Tax=Jaculus jaculus TaxID=51337 RepID=UPI00064D55DE|nr:testis-expressed protein 50 [Jaculus jaculus]